VERKPRKEKPRMEAPPVLVPQPNEKEFEAKKKAHDDEVQFHARMNIPSPSPSHAAAGQAH
jgi:hypothetical protein